MYRKDRIYRTITDGAVAFNNSQATRDEVFDRLIAWYFEHQSFDGECVVQNDNPAMDAPNILAEIADDIIKFDIKWDE